MNNISALPSLSIILVSFNTRQLTLACIQSIKHHPPQGDYEIIVVDNASSDGTVDAIRQQWLDVNTVASPVNEGFARANNIALKRAKGELLLLLNSDTEVHENALVRLQKFMRDHPEAALSGGKHFRKDGSIQPTIKYFPRPTNMLSEAFFLHRVFSGPIWSEHETRLDRYELVQEVEWLAGSYLAIRREWYARIGGLDGNFFMYAEDTDWCYRLRQAGGRIFYFPDSTITHYCGGSSKDVGKLSKMLCQSRDRYARLHFSPLGALVWRAALLCGLILRFAGILVLVPFRRELWQYACQRIAAAYAIIREPLPLTDFRPKVDSGRDPRCVAESISH